MTDTPATVAVATESSWLSKINWTQAVSAGSTVLTLATGYKYSIPAEQQLTIVAIIQGVQSVATWVMRTWFSKTVTSASVANATTTTTFPTTIAHIT